jgi:hypothetical protein
VLFALYINDIPSNLSPPSRLLADDLKLYHKVFFGTRMDLTETSMEKDMGVHVDEALSFRQ